SSSPCATPLAPSIIGVLLLLQPAEEEVTSAKSRHRSNDSIEPSPHRCATDAQRLAGWFRASGPVETGRVVMARPLGPRHPALGRQPTKQIVQGSAGGEPRLF